MEGVFFNDDDARRIERMLLWFEKSGLGGNASSSTSRTPVFAPRGFLVEITDSDPAYAKYTAGRLQADAGDFEINPDWTELDKDASNFLLELNGWGHAPIGARVWAYPSGDNFFWFDYTRKECWATCGSTGMADGDSDTFDVYLPDKSAPTGANQAAVAHGAIEAFAMCRLWWEAPGVILAVQAGCS